MTSPEPKTGANETGGPSLLIRGARVYRHDGDVDDPPVGDILIQVSRVVSVTSPDEDAARKHEIVRRSTTRARRR